MPARDPLTSHPHSGFHTPGSTHPFQSPEAAFKLVLEATRQLLTASDVPGVLAVAARAVVPHLGDWCVIRLFEPDGRLALRKSAHVSMTAEELEQLLGQSPAALTSPPCLMEALQANRPALFTHVFATSPAQPSIHTEEVRLLQQLGASTSAIIPLTGSRGPHGVLVLATGVSGRILGPEQLEHAAELGRSIALALEQVGQRGFRRPLLEPAEDRLGMIVHDLKNPLGSILLSASLLLRGAGLEGPDQRTRTHLELIRRSGERMHRMLQSLEDLTAIEAGRFELEPETCLVAHLVQVAVTQLQQQSTHKKQLKLEVEPIPEGLTVRCDRPRMGRVLLDLLENAAHLSAEGAFIRLRVETLGAGAGAGVRLEIMERGEGAGGAFEEHLFDLQWWTGRSARRGAGIALPVARQIVEAHGGRLWIERERTDERGFHIWLPAPR